jgi:hypothetical protein
VTTRSALLPHLQARLPTLVRETPTCTPLQAHRVITSIPRLHPDRGLVRTEADGADIIIAVVASRGHSRDAAGADTDTNIGIGTSMTMVTGEGIRGLANTKRARKANIGGGIGAEMARMGVAVRVRRREEAAGGGMAGAMAEGVKTMGKRVDDMDTRTASTVAVMDAVDGAADTMEVKARVMKT